MCSCGLGKGWLCGGVREEGGETAGPRPSGAFPPSAVTTPLAHSDSLCAVSSYLETPLSKIENFAFNSTQSYFRPGAGLGLTRRRALYSRRALQLSYCGRYTSEYSQQGGGETERGGGEG